MKYTAVFVIAIFILFGCQTKEKNKQEFLKVSKNGRHLETNEGKPFLYLGCTAWELFHKLDRDEATEYLTNRREKGFTVIQAVVLAELDGLRKPNAYGEIPLINLDPTTPNEKYFEHVDFIVNKAEELGLYIGMLPTWGDKIPNSIGGDGPVVFNPENARVYGEYLGKRYKNKPIVWILGGDRPVDNDTAFAIWKNMAEGLKSGDGGKHLISYHPRGGYSSSMWMHNEDWLDFNMYQTAHFRSYQEVYVRAQYDYNMLPAKPTVEAEPAYEDIPKEFWTFDWWSNRDVLRGITNADSLLKKPEFFKKGFFTDHDVRVHAYWDLLSGACGSVYGNNAVWQMFKKGDKVVIPCLRDWRESLNRPGSDDIRHIRKLFEARDFSKLIPDQSAIYGINYQDSTHIRAAVSNNGSYLLAYVANGQPVTIVMKKIAGAKAKAFWYDPREGKTREIGIFENKGFHTFTPPSSGKGNDWVLVIDDTAAKLPKLD